MKNAPVSRVRIGAISLVFIIALALPGIPSGAAIKAGSVCKKAQQVRVVKGVKFTCVKSGKKLVWRKSAVTAEIVSAAEVTPSPSPTSIATPSLSPIPTPIPTPPSDSLSYKNAMVYGLKDTIITRRADSGAYFETDSRSDSEFSEIRQRAFAELNKNPRNREHSNIDFIYEIRPSFPDFLTEYVKRELDEAAALWNDYFKKKFKVKVYLVTEKDREYIKGNSWLQNNLVSDFDRFDNRNSRPFIGGGAGFWQTNGEWMGNLFISAASWTDLNWMNYDWPHTTKHEFYHIVQDYAFYRNLAERPRSLHEIVQPIHFREGGANAISFLTSYRHLGWSSDALDWNFWMLARDSRNLVTINTESDAIKAMRNMECLKTCAVLSSEQPQRAFWWSYAYGAVMYEWVLGTYGKAGLLKMLDQLVTSTTFDQVTQGSFGLSKDEFYAKIAPYIVENIRRTQPYGN